MAFRTDAPAACGHSITWEDGDGGPKAKPCSCGGAPAAPAKSDAEQAREDHEAWKAKRDRELADAQAQVQKDAYDRAALAQVQAVTVPTGHVAEKSRLDEALEDKAKRDRESEHGGIPAGALVKTKN